MWGIVPAAGRGTRIQPLAFSKELLPVGSRRDEGVERPCAVSEYLLDRMVAAGATKLCFVIAPGKSDILAYYGASVSRRGDRLSRAAAAGGALRRPVPGRAPHRRRRAGGRGPPRHDLAPRRCAETSARR